MILNSYTDLTEVDMLWAFNYLQLLTFERLFFRLI